MSHQTINRHNEDSKPIDRRGRHGGTPQPYGKTLAELSRGTHRRIRMSLERWHDRPLLVAAVWERFDGITWVPRRRQVVAFNATEVRALVDTMRDLLASGEMEAAP